MTSTMRAVSTSRGRAAARTGRGLVSLAAAALLALATGCASVDGSPRSYSTSETKVSADVGEKFTLLVDENPSTGWNWYLATPKPDASVVHSAGDDYDADDGAQVLGAGGKHVFTFEASGAGSTEIILLHCHVYTCTGGTEPLAPASPTTSVSRPAPERITYTVTVS